MTSARADFRTSLDCSNCHSLQMTIAPWTIANIPHLVTGAEVPSLNGAFVCCYLLDGSLVAAESYVEAAPHTDTDDEPHDPGNITADSVSDGGGTGRARGRSKSG